MRVHVCVRDPPCRRGRGPARSRAPGPGRAGLGSRPAAPQQRRGFCSITAPQLPARPSWAFAEGWSRAARALLATVTLGEARAQHARETHGECCSSSERHQGGGGRVGLRWSWCQSPARGSRTLRDRAGSGRTGKSSMQNARNSRVLFRFQKTTTSGASRTCPAV